MMAILANVSVYTSFSLMLFVESMFISILKFCMCLFMGHLHLKLKIDLFNIVQTVLVVFVHCLAFRSAFAAF